jgi:hypothetical protein
VKFRMLGNRRGDPWIGGRSREAEPGSNQTKEMEYGQIRGCD